MKQTCLLLSVVLLFAIPGNFGECVLETVQGVPQYFCKSVQDLVEQGNSNVFDVVINKPSDTSTKKLKLKILLVEDAATNELSSDTVTLLSDLSNLFKGNRDVGTLSASLFANLPIKDLHLEDNGINNIESGALSNLKDLDTLYIVKNKLSIVKNGIFNNLPLDTLALSRNRIFFIEKDAFKEMYRLKHLHLDHNRLSEFQPEIIMNYPHILEELLLQHNALTDISRSTVRGFINLKHLNLDHNKISQCASYTFDDASKIEVLSLGNNKLLDLKAEAFPSDGLQKLQKLYIHNNRLSFLTTLTLEKFRQLEHVRIGGNPWQCPCLDAISTWLSDHNIQRKCDKDYYDGTRPACIVDDVHPTRCIYENDISHYVNYSEINNNYADGTDCVL